ncbi:MAG TPA: TonB-dependent receptor, partial [Candidatus Acidoferrales bacterium]|nr:TonB-dependent receptor [Candidatus Acidoferrales bacterium]
MNAGRIGKTRMLFAGLLMCLAVSAGPFARAQETFGTILGSVTDASGAPVGGVKITITNIGTGIVRSFEADATGNYVVSYLIPGTYSVSAAKVGFKTTTQAGIVLVVDQKARVDLKLQVGAVTETVNVLGTPPQIETESSEIGTVIASKQIVEAPLQIRDFAQLISLSPGVLQANGGGNVAGFTGAQFTNPDNQMGLSGNYVNGFFGDANNFQVDGVSNNEFTLGLIAVNPSIDGIAEFKVQTNTYSAEYGRAGGANVEISTKSGTNDFHGNLFEFVRNNMFDAIPWDVHKFSPNPKNPPLRENQFGGTFGGPIRKKRTFFFADFERFTERVGQNALLTVPTAKQRAGDFSEPGNSVIYNPYNTFTAPNTGGANCGPNLNQPCDGKVHPIAFGDGTVDATNVIPSAPICGPAKNAPCFSPAAVNILKLFPAPNITASIGQPNYFASNSFANDRNNIDARIDEHIADSDQLFLRFSFLQTTESNPNFLNATLGGPPWLAFNGKTKNENAVLSEIHNFSPSTTNEARFGVSHIGLSWFGFDSGTNESDKVGIPGVNSFCGFCSGLSYISLGGAFGPGYGDNSFHSIGHAPFTPTFRHEAVFQWVDDVSHVTGKHVLKAGADIQRVQVNLFQDFFALGDFAFTSQISSDLSKGGTGDSMASFLLGIPGSITRGHHLTFPAARATRFAFYGQDDYKLNRKLTLNLGLRYEYYAPPTDAHNNLANFDMNSGDILLACIATSCAGGVKPDKRNFAPRIGFAYSPDNGKTAIRSAFGISYYYPGFIWTTLDGQYPYTSTQNLNPATNAYFTSGDPLLDQGLPPTNNGIPNVVQRPGAPAGHLVPAGPGGNATVSMSTIDPNAAKTARTYQWTLDVQRSLTPTLLLDTAYVGSHSVHLYGRLGDINIPELGVATANPGVPLQKLRPLYGVDPQLASVTDNIFTGQGWYDALEAKLEKRFSHGLTFLASYTWAKALERGPFGSGNSPSQEGGSFYQDPFNYNKWKFVTPYNRAQDLTVSYNYELPLGRNGMYGKNWSSVPNTILG